MEDGLKKKKKRGRPSDPDRAETIELVRTLQPHSFFPPGLPPQHINAPTSLVCNVCLDVLNQPILLPCNELVCGLCYTQWVAVSGKTSCPCCFNCQMGRQEIREPPTAVMDMLGSLTIKCTNCHNSVKATRYLSHMKSKCEKDMMVTTPYELTVGEIIESITPPTAVEKKAAGRIIKRLMTQNSTAIIDIPV